MIIKVEISEETWARMLTGRRVEGTIGLDQWTGKKDLTGRRACSHSTELKQASLCTRSVADFNAFHRQPKKRLKDKLIKKLPWGWVKESEENLKVFSSVPKVYGFENVLDYMDQDHEEAKVALIKREMELMEFS